MRTTPGDESGFSLVELMVVVTILGILVVLALPTFLGARGRAQDRAAQATLRTGIAAARVCLTDQGDYATCDAAALGQVDSSIRWVDTPLPSDDVDVVSIAHGPSTWAAATMSHSGTCWLLEDALGSELSFGDAQVAVCTGTVAVGVTDPSW